MIDFFDLKTGAEYQQFITELQALGYKESHTSFIGGYVSRKIMARVTPYKGRFGEGVIIHCPTYLSTQYHLGTYFVLEN